jgi:hypothetical protein
MRIVLSPKNSFTELGSISCWKGHLLNSCCRIWINIIYLMRIIKQFLTLTMQFKHLFMKCTSVYREIFVAWGNLKVQQYLCACGKLRKVTTIFVVNVRLSAWNNSAPTGRTFMKFYILVFSENCPEKHVSLKWDKNNVHFTWRPAHIYDHISLSSS